jgi:hypothetical protein
MSGQNGQASGGGAAPSTVIHALVDIQVVPADIVSVTTCVSNANFYEPAAQAHLTSNATYKRYIAVKVSAQSNTIGTISIELYNVTQGTAGTPVTVSAVATNTEYAIAATSVTAQATNLGDVFTIKVKHSVNGATVTLNSGGIIEADKILDVSTAVNASPPSQSGCYMNSLKYYMLSGLTTAAATCQPSINLSGLGAGSLYSLGSPSSTMNSSITVTLLLKMYSSGNNTVLVISGLTGQLLLGQAVGLSADNQ